MHSQCFTSMFQVKFSLDNIDETDLLEDILKPRVDSLGGTLEKVTLAGSHLTPCAQVSNVRWYLIDNFNALIRSCMLVIRQKSAYTSNFLLLLKEKRDELTNGSFCYFDLGPDVESW